MRRLAIGIGILLLAVLAAAAGGFVWLSQQGLPQREGEAHLPGLGAPVEVRWDRWGVPHVAAADLLDAVAAQGWLHANDRFTQMELGRRAAAGRLSELFGERAVAADRYFRTLRLGRTAERLWQAASPDSRSLLTAYAAGVNAWLSARRDDLPPSLVLLRAKIEPWRPADSLGFVLLMAEDLSFWDGRPEEARFAWLRAFGRSGALDLVGDPAAHVPPEIELLAAPAPGEAVLGGAPPSEGPLGSNNWAIGASRSASGSPLLANDPHLPLSLPGTWYQLLLRAPGFEAAGMSLPGLPGVVIGRSADCAWALTNAMLDDHDLFFERLDDTGERVERAGEWVPLEVETELIRVRGGEDVELTLHASDRGPLLPANAERGLPPRSLAWTLYEQGDPVAVLLTLPRAGTVAEALGGLAGYIGPAQNLVLADRRGGLAFTVFGRVPERRRGDGRFPAPGWDPSYGWQGLRDRGTNPTVVDPPADLLVTANHDTRPPGYPLPFTADYDLPHRAARIEELLSGRDGWRVEDLARVQGDVVSRYAREVVALLGRERYDGAAAEAMALLASWDGTMSGPPAALYALVERELGPAIFGDEAKRHDLASLGSRPRVLRALAGDMSPAWLDDVGTAEVEDRRTIAGRALTAAWRAAREQGGEDPSRWRWEEIHQLPLSHPLGALPLLGLWLDRGPYPVPGSATTVNAFGGHWQTGAQRVSYGPSMRWLTDLGDPDASLAVLPGGQSGHPADPHYDDQIPLYLAGRMRPVAWSEEAVERAAVARLTLIPGSPAETGERRQR